MISLIKFANIIENGLNTVLNDPNIEFRIWATAGQKDKSIRNGNTVTHFITGNLRSVSSSNEGNVLSMGYNGLSLEIAVPINPPKTNAGQTPEQLAPIVNSQYPFVDKIISVVDTYFQLASVLVEQDDKGDAYTISLSAGRAVTGDVNLAAQFGNFVTVSVFIGATFLQGGVNSRNVQLYIDGKQVPLTNFTLARSNRMTNDQYSGDDTIKNMSTATALSLDFVFPSNADNTTKEAVRYLLHGKTNIAHFAELIYGDEDGQVHDSELYFVIFDNLSSNAQGVSFAGISGSVIEVVDNPLMLNVPDYFQVGRFEFTDSQEETLTFTITECTAFIGGTVQKMNGAQTVSLTPDDFVYSPEDDKYYVYLITMTDAETPAATTVSGASATFTVIKEAT